MAPSARVSTNPNLPTQPRPPIAAYRELIGLLLLLIAAACILVAAYRTDLDLGLAVTGVLVGAGGLAMTTGRTSP